MTEDNIAVEYWKWVDKLGAWFFCPENEGQQVRLFWPLDDEYSNQKENFMEVIRGWYPRITVIDIALKLKQLWNPEDGTFRYPKYFPGLDSDSTSVYPPYIPYLVCFAMAWGEEGSYNPHAYYARLNNLLHLAPGNDIGCNQFKYMDRIWRDLEKWANQIKGGELGIFSAYSAGHMVHVGFPLSQVVLSPSDRKALNDVFSREGLTSDMAIEDSEILGIISDYIEYFTQRTRATIQQQNPLFLQALYEEVRIELANYAPSYNERVSVAGIGSASGAIYNRLRLTCQVGLHGVDKWTFMLFKEVTDFQEIKQGAYIIRPGQSQGVLWQQTENGESCDPVHFNNYSFLGEELRITGSGKRFLWAGRSVRFFAPSRNRGGLLYEQDILPEAGPVIVLLLATDTMISSKIRCIELGGNIPRGYKLLRTDDVQVLHELFPSQRLHKRYHNPIILIDGIKLFPWKEIYFSYALPLIYTPPEWSLESGNATVSFKDSGEPGIRTIILHGDCIPDEILIIAFDNHRRRRTKKFGIAIHPHVTPPQIFGDTNDDGIAIKEPDILVHNNDPFPTWNTDISSREMSLFENPAIHAWEVMSTWGHFSYDKFRNTIELLHEGGLYKASHIALNFQSLGHIIIDNSATNGLWNGVRMTRGSLCQLPWNIALDGRVFVQAVLVGNVEWGHLLGILDDLPEDVSCDVCPQPYIDAPPRIRFWAPTIRHLQLLAESLLLHWHSWGWEQAIPSIDDFNSYLDKNWIDGLLSTGESTSFFSVCHLQDHKCTEKRFKRLCKISGRYLLATQEQTYGLSEYYLLDILNNRRTHLFARHRQWGRWISYLGASDLLYRYLYRSRKEYQRKYQMSIPYNSKVGILAFPRSLKPPMVIDRLLCSCSGLLPTSCPWEFLCPEISNLQAECLDTFDSPIPLPINSHAIIYNNVPSTVAQYIGSRLNVALLDIDMHIRRR